LATDAKTPYLLGDGDWARADKVLLSGYEPGQRLRMIDALMESFKHAFGYYPQSAGAWYMDAVSINYMVQKYKVKAFMQVSDQYMTDSYGMWGMPWGVPYIPSKLNPLIPFSDYRNKQNAVMIQWAARDPVAGYGLGVPDSTYSVQANDYIDHHALDTSYFVNLAGRYFGASERINQLTIGLEVGQESIRFLSELARQVDSLKSGKFSVSFLTMKEFSDEMQNSYADAFPYSFISNERYDNPAMTSYWYNSPYYRARISKIESNLILEDLREYDKNFMFGDVGSADGDIQLTRIVPACIDKLLKKNEKVLVTDVSSLHITRTEDQVVFEVQQTDGKLKKIVLKPQEIQSEYVTLFSVKKTSWRQNVVNYLKRIFLTFETNRYHSFLGGIRFTKLENAYYLGMTTPSGGFWGIRTTPLYVGSFQFPFQVLVRFKSLKVPSISGFVGNYFSKTSDQCTIKL
jgi:hypothetical protein